MRDYTSLEPPPPSRPFELPPYSRTVPLLVAALGLLMVFLVLVWVLFTPETFGQRLIAFAVASVLMVYLVSLFDGLQRRSVERLQLRLVMEGRLAVAQALAKERDEVLMKFLSTFVVKVHGSAGDMLPYGGPFAINVGGQPIDVGSGRPDGEHRGDPRADPRHAPAGR
jgi:hypothetical protein